MTSTGKGLFVNNQASTTGDGSQADRAHSERDPAGCCEGWALAGGQRSKSSAVKPSLTMTQPIHRNRSAGTWISWLGSPTQFLIVGRDTNEHYCISRGKSPVGGGAPPHSHDFEEGFYLLSGKLTFRAGNHRTTLEAGDFINIQGGVAHSIENESGEEAEVLIVCAPAGFDQFQIEGGYPMDGPDSPVTPFDAEGRERLLKSARKFRINMGPSEQDFLLEPRVKITRKTEGVTVDVVGDRYRFLATQEHTNGKYSIWHADLSPGGGPPPHIHRREEEGFFILEGRITFYSEDESFIAEPGDFVHLPRNGLHRFQNETEETARTLILVAPGGLEEMFFQSGLRVEDRSKPLNPPSPEEIAKLVEVAPAFGIELKLPAH